MWILYLIYIFAAMFLVVYHAAQQQDNKLLKIGFSVLGGVLTVLSVVVPAVYIILLNNWSAVLYMPAIGCASVLALGLCVKVSLINRQSTLNEYRQPALIGWGWSLVTLMIFPFMRLTNGDDSTKVYIYKALKYVSEYESASMLMILVLLVILPLSAILINRFIPAKLFIWVNLAMIMMHCIGYYYVGIFFGSESSANSFLILRLIEEGNNNLLKSGLNLNLRMSWGYYLINANNLRGCWHLPHIKIQIKSQRKWCTK